MSFICIMFKLKITDRCLTFVFYMFLVSAFFALGSSLYDKYTGHAKEIDFSSVYTFIFFAFFTRYQYAIQYWLQKAERINNEERKRHLAQENMNNGQ